MSSVTGDWLKTPTSRPLKSQGPEQLFANEVDDWPSILTIGHDDKNNRCLHQHSPQGAGREHQALTQQYGHVVVQARGNLGVLLFHFL